MPPKTPKTIWISKYALSKGVYQTAAVIRDTGYAYPVSDDDGRPCYVSIGPGNWHETREEAIDKARQARDDKIKSLKKQLKKLEELSFE